MKKNKRGFTLIELLVVIAIIGLLASVVLVALSSSRAKARDARRKSDQVQLMKALELYYDKYGHYPCTNWRYSNQGDQWIVDSCPGGATNLSEFMPVLPKDPKNSGGAPYSGGYTYAYFATGYPTPGGTGRWYMLVVRPERSNDPDIGKFSVTDCLGNTRAYTGTLTRGADCQ